MYHEHYSNHRAFRMLWSSQLELIVHSLLASHNESFQSGIVLHLEQLGVFQLWEIKTL